MIQELLNSVVDEKNLQTSLSNPTSQPQQNLRCPRCDSSNTKFCYYNNYNLTQPRHFCKTCRRYWTKGGALRNVPIGGGCRKAKPFSSTIATTTSNSNNISMDRPDLLPSPWGSMAHGPHLLALLRASQLQNANQNSNIGLYQPQHLQYNLLNDGPTSSGLQDLYQRLRSSTGGFCNNDFLPVVSANNVSSSVSAMPAVSMEPGPLATGEFGYWNSNVSWSDLSTTNGAYN